jgi:NAD-dependent SIR2 family protein deacetylase
MARLGEFTKRSCSDCPETDREKFPIDKRRPNGILPRCIKCTNLRARAFYHANLEYHRLKVSARKRAWRLGKSDPSSWGFQISSGG